MNEPENHEPPKKELWRLILKFQIIGALLAGLLTAIVNVSPPGGGQGYLGFMGAFSGLSLMPTFSLLNLPMGWFSDPQTGGFIFSHICLAIIINSLLGFIFGTLIGLLKSKKQKA
jgi:hypothetical protein